MKVPDREIPTRECDRQARKLLSPHGSRVFSAPPHEALASETYPEACALARAATGKAISKQCWHLFPKIREFDVISDPRIRESHPELVFAQLNGSKPVAASKKSMAGQNERLRLLRKVLPASIAAYLHADIALGQGDYLPDDCIDALALCLAAREPEKMLQRVERQQALHVEVALAGLIADRGFDAKRPAAKLESQGIASHICPKNPHILAERLREPQFHRWQTRRGAKG